MSESFTNNSHELTYFSMIHVLVHWSENQNFMKIEQVK